MTVNKKIEFLLEEATTIATNEMVKRARKILRDHPSLDEFIIAMGTFFFTRKNGTTISFIGDEPKYMEDLKHFIREWDHVLHLTGLGFRFTATSDINTNW